MGYFETNIAAIARARGTAPRVPPDDGRSFVDESSGGATLFLAGVEGGRLALSSRRDPLGEAHRKLDEFLQGAGMPRLIVLIGLGLGHLVDAIEQRSPTTRILALEPEPSCVPHLLRRRDFAALLDSKRLFLFWGPDYEGATDGWQLFDGSEELPPTIVHPVIARTSADACAEAVRLVRRLAFGARANAEARKKLAGRYFFNTLRNLPVILRWGDVASLDGAFEGVPGIIISAGPSLDENIKDLPLVAGRAVLIAADTALRPLLSAGIHPHLVVAVDPSEANGRHLQHLPDTGLTHLVAEASLDPAAFDAFAGHVFTFRVGDHDPWPWLRARGLDRGTLRAWGSVATSAFDLALRMGCNPVVFAGQDLAYTGGRLYCNGTTFGGAWSEAAIAAAIDQAVRAPDIRGCSTATTPTLVAFRDWLVEQSTRQTDRRFINATGAGILMGPRVEQQASLCVAIPAREETVDPFAMLSGVAHTCGSERVSTDPAVDDLIQSIAAEATNSAAFRTATEALCRILRLSEPATGLLDGYRNGCTSDLVTVTSAFEWIPEARPDVALLERLVRIASALAQPASRHDTVDPFRWTVHASAQAEAPDVAEARLPRTAEAVGWWARRALVLAWARLFKWLPGVEERGTREIASRLAEWLADLAAGPQGTRLDESSAVFAVRLSGSDGQESSFRFDLRSPLWRLMPALTGTLVRSDDAAGAIPRPRSGEPSALIEAALESPDSRPHAVRCSIEAEPAPASCRPDPRVRFLHRREAWIAPVVLDLGASYTVGILDSEHAFVTPYMERCSHAIDADGGRAALPEWPNPIVGEQPGPATGGVAWSNAHPRYLMRRCSADARVETVVPPFRPARAIVVEDGTSYWSATTGGLWRWERDGRMVCVAVTPPLHGLARHPDGIRLDPVSLDLRGEAHRAVLTRGWLWRTGAKEVEQIDLGPLGQMSRLARSGTLWAAAHPSADTVRIGGRGSSVFDLACDWPHDAAWAGDSLVVATARGSVLLFKGPGRLLEQRRAPDR